MAVNSQLEQLDITREEVEQMTDFVGLLFTSLLEEHICSDPNLVMVFAASFVEQAMVAGWRLRLSQESGMLDKQSGEEETT